MWTAYPLSVRVKWTGYPLVDVPNPADLERIIHEVPHHRIYWPHWPPPR
jgi:hypothetical protein